jgi:hypothetical protein
MALRSLEASPRRPRALEVWELSHTTLHQLRTPCAPCGTATTSPRWPDRPLKSTSRSWSLSCSSSPSSFYSPRFRSCHIAPQVGRGTMSPQREKEEPTLAPSFLSSPAAKPCTSRPTPTPPSYEHCKTNCKTPSISQPGARQINQGLARMIVLGTVESSGQLSGLPLTRDQR